MLESVLLTTFLLGLISAVSLPLGTLTAFLWRPTDRAIAIMMAFGGGALLAALTLDLVGPAVARGDLISLGIGVIAGGVMFVVLNSIINDYGGFLRKVSTTVYYLRRKQHQRLERIATQLKRVDLFNVLSKEDFRILAASINHVEYNRGSWIYQSGDPSDNLYIIMGGDVLLINPRDRTQMPEHLKKYDVFGWRAVITGTPHCYSALANSKVSLWVLPKRAIDILNLNSEQSRSEVYNSFKSENILRYLEQDQGLDRYRAEQWLHQASCSLLEHGVIPPATKVSRKRETFRSKIEYMQHIPLTQGLTASMQELISDRLIYKFHRRGSSFYFQNESADRMFIIENGEVNLFDSNASSNVPQVLHDYDAFGDISMITGANHSVTAIAVEDTTVWELRKADFDELLERSPELRDRVRVYIRQAGADGYLVDRHNIDEDNTARWMRQAMRSVDAGMPIPPAADIRHEITENKGAPFAIWLGITLDGIPESLVIGASMLHAQVETSLIVGLFLANYPEALSSSIGMLRQGMEKSRILLMWTSLMLFTGIGAALGSVIFIGASPSVYVLIEGLAAGAMLTMIAETMLPEAYFKGGSVVGLSTLMGFLAAIFSKAL
ncbi:MAG: cyclic nucleotide-binding domain-containing protein [Gammaproteobacteria bacterium]|nr:cyclic nucleotide-binding domain-containing protein [Gammaproteobacteria bacterium]